MLYAFGYCSIDKNFLNDFRFLSTQCISKFLLSYKDFGNSFYEISSEDSHKINLSGFIVCFSK